jgi:hypothetical protein
MRKAGKQEKEFCLPACLVTTLRDAERSASLTGEKMDEVQVEAPASMQLTLRDAS